MLGQNSHFSSKSMKIYYKNVAYCRISIILEGFSGLWLKCAIHVLPICSRSTRWAVVPCKAAEQFPGPAEIQKPFNGLIWVQKSCSFPAVPCRASQSWKTQSHVGPLQLWQDSESASTSRAPHLGSLLGLQTLPCNCTEMAVAWACIEATYGYLSGH